MNFEQMSPQEKRVAIAKDVLLRLSTKAIRAESSYLKLETKDGRDGWDVKLGRAPEIEDQQLNTAISEGKIICRVCADGALFLSHVMFSNHLTVKQATDIVSFHQVQNRLQEIFSRDQLLMIETAFEGRAIHDEEVSIIVEAPEEFDAEMDEVISELTLTPLGDKLVLWRDQFDEAEDAMRAIMENIIQHEGEFTID